MAAHRTDTAWPTLDRTPTQPTHSGATCSRAGTGSRNRTVGPVDVHRASTWPVNRVAGTGTQRPRCALPNRGRPDPQSAPASRAVDRTHHRTDPAEPALHRPPGLEPAHHQGPRWRAHRRPRLRASAPESSAELGGIRAPVSYAVGRRGHVRRRSREPGRTTCQGRPGTGVCVGRVGGVRGMWPSDGRALGPRPSRSSLPPRLSSRHTATKSSIPDCLRPRGPPTRRLTGTAQPARLETSRSRCDGRG
ncbi:hypothetical protein SAMN02982929_00803 [Saccharopolyspora kobensis]|uniref:Uncharacterized protein n=1 Tax=Saccharopolyspora kobensis TaxID=146035 RepID=A0A1H5V8B5_9PSEU|nr:hypothetical protein SAMN02982929_00803 [Saccharopolyspora kobensis]SFC63793.1 hypothetical protein SAMN05216506_1011267 [Saccharopolyspora kobensis]